MGTRIFIFHIYYTKKTFTKYPTDGTFLQLGSNTNFIMMMHHAGEAVEKVSFSIFGNCVQMI